MKYKDTNTEEQALNDGNTMSKNNNPKLDIDDKKIKAHLNASFDLNSIQVSEELINRTMSAIKEQSAHTDNNQASVVQPSKKSPSWNRSIRGVAGVAAAILLITVGINVMKQNSLMKSSDEAAQSTDNSQYDMVTEESAQVRKAQKFASESTESEAAGTMQAEDSVGIASVEVPENNIYRYSVTADIIDNGTSEDEKADTTVNQEENGNQDSSSNIEKDKTEDETLTSDQQDIISNDDTPQIGIMQGRLSDTTNTKTSPKMALAAGESALKQAKVSFKDIFLSNPSQAEYLTITDEVNNVSITLTKQVDIDEFYAMMEQQQYILQTQEENQASSANAQNYEVQIKNPNPNAMYTLIIGDNLIVRYLEGDNIIENIYLTEDEVLFLMNFEAFFKQHSKQ